MANQDQGGRANFLHLLSQIGSLTDEELNQLMEEVQKEIKRRENLQGNRMETSL